MTKKQGSKLFLVDTVDKHIKNTYLKQIQTPIGVKPVLKCWMELS